MYTKGKVAPWKHVAVPQPLLNTFAEEFRFDVFWCCTHNLNAGINEQAAGVHSHHHATGLGGYAATACQQRRRAGRRSGMARTSRQQWRCGAARRRRRRQTSR
jgi:hypothetical protein